MTATRLERLRESLAADGLDALIVQGEANLRYLTGYTGSNGLALVRAGGGDRFFTDFRYASQIVEQLDPAFDAEVAGGSELLDALAARLEGGRVGFDDTTTSVRRRAKLGELAGARVQFVAAAGLVEALRAVKDEAEIAAIAAAAALTDSIYEWLFSIGLGGRTERELAVALEHEMRLRGAAGPSFPSIVASGAAGALPHASPRDVPVEPGTLVTVDIGSLLGGYCSDCTRTVAVGEPSSQARERSTRSCSPRSSRGLPALPPAWWAARWTPGPDGSSTKPAMASSSDTASATASGSRSTRRPAWLASARTRSCARATS